MKEVDLQSKCVTAIREIDGFAQKMSNRFLIGVPDLLCQLPCHRTSFWEVKRRGHFKQDPSPTPKQKLWLRDFTWSGGLGGVICFVIIGNDLAVAIRPASVFDLDNIEEKWRIGEEHYKLLPRGCKMQPFKDELVRVHVDRNNRTGS